MEQFIQLNTTGTFCSNTNTDEVLLFYVSMPKPDLENKKRWRTVRLGERKEMRGKEGAEGRKVGGRSGGVELLVVIVH
ncbi:hypothetical protein HAX54_038534, partial [Datura stramonium]|nr:hypothetical protein [Datura stramonium]